MLQNNENKNREQLKQNENNDKRFDTAVRIIINGVHAELNVQSSRQNQISSGEVCCPPHQNNSK